jgi:hypothetical protein
MYFVKYISFVMDILCMSLIVDVTPQRIIYAFLTQGFAHRAQVAASPEFSWYYITGNSRSDMERRTWLSIP